MDLLLPIPVRVSKCTTSIISNTALSRSIFSGASRTLARSGSRFGFDFTITGANDKESFPMRRALRSLQAGLNGQANRIWVADPSYKLAGSFPTGELLVNGTFAAGSAGWTPSNGTLNVADGYARVQTTGTGGSAIVANSTVAAIVSGAAYAVRALTFPGNISSWAVIGGPTSGTNTYVSSGVLTTQGLFAAGFVASGTAFFIGLQCISAVIADFDHFLFASLSRCALVNGAGQTGTTLNIDALPISTAGLLLPGDRVQIGTQLNTVVAPLNSNGSGQGLLQCALPWRSSPADNSAVIIDKPMARCVLPSNSNSWNESPGGFADFQFTLEESLDV